MDTQIAEHLSAARIRRDVQTIRDAVAALVVGEVGRVVIRSPRYGLYIIDGPVRTGVGGQPMIADVILGTGSEIQRLYPSTDPPVAPAGHTAPEGLNHGDLVRVTFTTPAHGTFAITGPLTAGQDGFLLVGSWIVADGGLVSPRVTAIEPLADIEAHETNIPPLRSVMEEATSVAAGEGA